MSNILYKQLMKSLKHKLRNELDIIPESFKIIKTSIEPNPKFLINNEYNEKIQFPTATVDLFEAKVKEAINAKYDCVVEIINSIIIDFDFKNDCIDVVCTYNHKNEFTLTI